LLPRLVKSFASEFPLIHLVTLVLSSDEVMNAVAEGLTDLDFAFSPSPTERVTTHLHRRFRIAPLSSPIAQIGIATRLQNGSLVFTESEPATEEFAAITDVRTV
jgi:DNA-binding transcriptional LysR family regulator